MHRVMAPTGTPSPIDPVGFNGASMRSFLGGGYLCPPTLFSPPLLSPPHLDFPLASFLNEGPCPRGLRNITLSAGVLLVPKGGGRRSTSAGRASKPLGEAPPCGTDIHVVWWTLCRLTTQLTPG